MLNTQETVKTEEIKNINSFIRAFDSNVVTVEEEVASPVSRYISSLVCGQYQKSVEDIENTKVGNKIVKRRNLQQIMQESFFCGANRFGNNFIA